MKTKAKNEPRHFGCYLLFEPEEDRARSRELVALLLTMKPR